MAFKLSGAAFGGVYRSRTSEFMRRRGPARKTATTVSQWDHGEGGAAGEDAALINDELTNTGAEHSRRTDLPPEWVDDLDACNEVAEAIRARMKELNTMHHKHITQPSFDGGMEQEQEIEITTSEITSLFHKCQKLIQQIGRKGKASTSPQHKRLATNVVSSLAKDIQDLSMTFRKSQSNYLKRMRGREDRDRSYGLGGSAAGGGGGSAVDAAIDDEIDLAMEVGDAFTDEQIDRLKENTSQVAQREQEITNIVSSIHELTDIFKDLAQLITEQGSILDRIDYNIEMASHHVEKGRVELEQANTYQKRASKKLCIMLMIVICVGLFFAIVFKKKVTDHSPSPAPTAAPQQPPPPSPALHW